MNLYSQYLAEREGASLIEEPWGFVTYKVQEPGVVYIVDIYIVPEMRNEGRATFLANKVIDKTNATVVVGSIDPEAKEAHTSLLVLLGYGMQLWKVDGSLILFKKDVI